MSLRDYDKLTPKERREKAALVEELHRKRLLTDETAKKLTRTCPEAPPDTREDEKSNAKFIASPLPDGYAFAYIMGRMPYWSSEKTLEMADMAKHRGWLTEEQYSEVVNTPMPWDPQEPTVASRPGTELPTASLPGVSIGMPSNGVRPCWEMSPNSGFRRCLKHGYLFEHACSACRREG